MLSPQAATKAVLEATQALPSEAVSLDAAVGRTLRQIIRAERDQPPFDRVMMDGIAIRATDFESGTRRFPIQATQAAGDLTTTLDEGHCIEVMTGTALPVNADCIVPVERIQVEDNAATIEADYDATKMQFVHPRGSDFARGAHLLTPGRPISAMDIATIASCGVAEVEVAVDPVVRIISTGNELVPAGNPVADHQIRLSNGPALRALLATHGFRNAAHDHIVDDVATLKERIGKHLTEARVLILSGGVSMGQSRLRAGSAARTRRVADFSQDLATARETDVVWHRA